MCENTTSLKGSVEILTQIIDKRMSETLTLQERQVGAHGVATYTYKRNPHHFQETPEAMRISDY